MLGVENRYFEQFHKDYTVVSYNSPTYVFESKIEVSKVQLESWLPIVIALIKARIAF